MTDPLPSFHENFVVLADAGDRIAVSLVGPIDVPGVLGEAQARKLRAWLDQWLAVERGEPK